jgi:hypothetical protein
LKLSKREYEKLSATWGRVTDGVDPDNHDRHLANIHRELQVARFEGVLSVVNEMASMETFSAADLIEWGRREFLTDAED